MIAINTTGGTASEMTRFCIITDEARHIVMAIVDKHGLSLLSVNDSLMIGMPKLLTAATGMDALTHATQRMLWLRHADYRRLCTESCDHDCWKNSPAAEDAQCESAKQLVMSVRLAWRSTMLLWVMFMRWRTSWAVSITRYTVYVTPFCRCKVQVFNIVAAVSSADCAAAMGVNVTGKRW